MGKKQTCPAVHLKAKKARILAANLHCNIPSPQPPAKTLEADFAYRELRDKRKKELRRHSRTATGHIRIKTPWYMLTKGKIYRYETHHESWGDNTAWFSVDSEIKRTNEKLKIPKFTKNKLIIGYLDKKMQKWIDKHPEPKKDDLFYKEEHPKWVSDYESQHDKVVKSLVDHHIDRYNKETITAVLNSRSKYSVAA